MNRYHEYRRALSDVRVRKAAGAVERFLGGKPDIAGINKYGDIYGVRGNKKFRMDINRPGFKNGRKTPEEPHFHLEEFKNGEWQDAGNGHRFFFRNKGVKK